MSQQVTVYTSKKTPERDFTIVSNLLIRDGEALSDSAFRLLTYFMSNSETWTVYQSKIRKDLNWGKDKLQKYMKELEEKRYLKKWSRKDENGFFSALSYECSSVPFDKESENSNNFTVAVFSGTGSSGTGKPVTTNTNLTKNNLNEVVCSAAPVGSHFPEKKEEISFQEEKDLQEKKASFQRIVEESKGLKETLVKTNHSGQQLSVSISEVMTTFLRQRKDYTTKEIHFAWKQLEKTKNPISDCVSYLEGIIKHQRTLKKNEAFIAKKHKEEICNNQQKTQETQGLKIQVGSSLNLSEKDMQALASPKLGKSILDYLSEA